MKGVLGETLMLNTGPGEKTAEFIFLLLQTPRDFWEGQLNHALHIPCCPPYQ